MDDHHSPPTAAALPSFETVLDEAADRLADALTRDIEHALADPMVRLLLAAEGFDGHHVASVLRRLAVRLGARARNVNEERGVPVPYSF